MMCDCFSFVSYCFSLMGLVNGANNQRFKGGKKSTRERGDFETEAQNQMTAACTDTNLFHLLTFTVYNDALRMAKI